MMVEQQALDALVERAKKWLSNRIGGDRQFLYVGSCAPYEGTVDSGARVWALEGSPLKGFVIACGSQVWVYDGSGARIKIFSLYKPLWP